MYCDHCVGETITVEETDVTIKMEQGSGTGNVITLDVKSVTDSNFNGTEISDSSNGCDAIYFYAFTDSELTISFSDPSVSLSAADAISPAVASVTTQNLVVDTSSAGTTTLYLQGKNTGKESAFITLLLFVCSSLVLDPGFSLSYDLLQTRGEIVIIPNSTYLGNITGDCTIDFIELVKSPDLDSEGQHTPNDNDMVTILPDGQIDINLDDDPF